MSLIYDYPTSSFQKPSGNHLWRQSDCLSQTLNYAEDENPLLEPSVHFLGHSGTGKTMSEFPVFYYIIGQVWKVTGTKEFIYRFSTLLFFFFGLLALFKLFESTLKDSVIALLIALLMFTSPILIFYGNNFLMNIPALGLGLVGLFFFHRFTQTENNLALWFSCLFYLIAGLLKIPSLLCFCAICAIFLMNVLGIMKNNPTLLIFKKPLRQAIPLLLVLAAQILWYRYADFYNSENNGQIFLIGIIPVWEMSFAEIQLTIDAIFDHFKNNYFMPTTQVLAFISLILSLVYFRFTNQTYVVISLFSLFGFLLFSLFFFQALKQHDYYIINQLVIIPLSLLGTFAILKKKLPTIFRSVMLKTALLLFLIVNIGFAQKKQQKRFNPNGWQNELYSKGFLPYQTIEPYLVSIGITRTDTVLCLSDNSFNTSLYAMNRKGWTNFGVWLEQKKIEKLVERGASYLLIHDEKSKTAASVQPFLSKKIGQYESVSIYKLK